MKTILFYVILLSLSVFAQAEMRVWTDINGKKVRAEFVQELFESVFLKTSDGKELNIKVENLSPDDLTYIRTMIPPEVTVRFSTKTKLKERSSYAQADDTISIVTGMFTVKKERYPVYHGTLIAEVFMIGRELATPDVYVLLGRSREPFTLTQENDLEHIIEATVEVRSYVEYNNQNRGNEFAGYVLVVEDKSERSVALSSNLNWMKEDKIEALRDLKSGNFLNQQFKKVSVPRPEYYNTRHVFGRSSVRSTR